MRAVLLGAMLAVAAAGQQFTWEGDVSGVAVVHVRGKKVEVEVRDGAPVSGAKFRFATPLPETRQTLRLEVRQGRGAVRLIAQPGVENEYSASILIEDRQDGTGHYSIALSWDRAAATPSGKMDRLRWTGTVEGEAVVECSASKCVSKAERGGPVFRERFKFSRPLPDLEAHVLLDETGGQADIRILEQPSARNGYAVKVGVRALNGATPCTFALSWERAPGR